MFAPLFVPNVAPLVQLYLVETLKKILIYFPHYYFLTCSYGTLSRSDMSNHTWSNPRASSTLLWLVLTLLSTCRRPIGPLKDLSLRTHRSWMNQPNPFDSVFVSYLGWSQLDLTSEYHPRTRYYRTLLWFYFLCIGYPLIFWINMSSSRKNSHKYLWRHDVKDIQKHKLEETFI